MTTELTDDELFELIVALGKDLIETGSDVQTALEAVVWWSLVDAKDPTYFLDPLFATAWRRIGRSNTRH